MLGIRICRIRISGVKHFRGKGISRGRTCSGLSISLGVTFTGVEISRGTHFLDVIPRGKDPRGKAFPGVNDFQGYRESETGHKFAIAF